MNAGVLLHAACQTLTIHLANNMLAQSYPEFCRALYDAAPAEFNTAVMDFEAAHGKVSSP